MSDTTYNGWTNYETWSVKLWMDNDQGSSEYWNERAIAAAADTDADDEKDTRLNDAATELAAEIEQQHDEIISTANLTGPFADIMGSALARVNWREIAASLLSDLDEDDWE